MASSTSRGDESRRYLIPWKRNMGIRGSHDAGKVLEQGQLHGDVLALEGRAQRGTLWAVLAESALRGSGPSLGV